MGARDAITRHNQMIRRKRDDRPLTRQEIEDATRLAFGHAPDDDEENDLAEWPRERFVDAVACLLIGSLLALGIIAGAFSMQG